MASMVEKCRRDTGKLIKKGELLLISIIKDCNPDQYAEIADGLNSDEPLPIFEDEYQSWYTEAKSVIQFIIPDRFDNFIGYYQPPESREYLTDREFCLEDFLRLTEKVKHHPGYEGWRLATIDIFRQQLAILRAAPQSLESSLFNIRQLVQADLLDSEIDSAREFLEGGHLSAAGVVAGLALEKHLAEMVERHGINIGKKKRTIGNLNDLLKGNDILQIDDWRALQRLSDLRNMCAHSGDPEPTKEKVLELIEGVSKFTKTLS